MKNFLLSLAVLALPASSWAQSWYSNNQSQKATGMAGAGSALFTDESAIFYNPGGLAKMDHNAVSVGGSALMYLSSFKQLKSNNYHHSTFKILPPFSAFAAFGPKDSWWKAGIGVYTPYGRALNWGNQWVGRDQVDNLYMQAIAIQPTLSFKLTDNFAVGGGFVYNVGLFDLSHSLPDANGKTMGQADLSGTGTGMGFNIGVHYHLEDEIAVSLSYRSKITTKFRDADADFSVPNELAAAYPNTSFDMDIPLPSTFNIGLAFPVGERVDIAADASIIGYSIYKEQVIDYQDNTSELVDSKTIKKYENALSGKVGINYEVSDKLDLRAGVGYVYTPVKGPYVSPEDPDNANYMGSLGFTYRFHKHWDLTASYLFQKLGERSSQNINTGLAGTYKSVIHTPGLSLTYAW